MSEFDHTFRRQLRDLALQQRQLGQGEFRICAARMLIEANWPDAARLVLLMAWDEWATEDERTERERMPE